VLIAGAEVAGRAPVDVSIDGGRIAAIGPALERRPADDVLEAGGGALLPGLHDHHIHLFALAAVARSVACGPPAVADAEALGAALRRGAPGEWVRGVGYHESVAGDLDRWRLDALAGDRPVRVQHRSGMLWILSSVAIARLGLEHGPTPPGVERDARGRPTGRLFRLDAWLRARLGGELPSLADVGVRLAERGVTGVTDATATNDAAALAALTAAVRAGELPQRLLVMGAPELPPSDHPGIARGAVKLVLDDRELPALDALSAAVAVAHAAGRSVAVHCVSRAALVLAAAALDEAGVRPGDRVEHASVAPPDVVPLLAGLGVAVVTQPGFVRTRGDAYLRDVEPEDRSWLYRGRGLLQAGIPLAAGSDAPFGDADPWPAMQAAVDRRTEAGRVLGAAESLTPEEALALFTTPPETPGAPPRRLAPGALADLCLLDRPWAAARRALAGVRIRATLVGGTVVWRG